MAMPKNKGEKQELDRSMRSQTGYGSAPLSSVSNKNTPQTRYFISHRLLRTDTLMGITLKYGVTIQDLKKENKLWNNDHLFLRETLLIPLTSDNEGVMDENDTIIVCDGSSSNLPSPSTHSHLPNGGITGSSASSLRHSASSDSTAFPNGASPLSSSSSFSKSPDTSNDFFAKYDTSIARLKGDVAKMERNTANLVGIIDTNPLALPPRKGSSTSSRKDSNTSTVSSSERRQRYVIEEDGRSSPVLLIRSWTSNRHVKMTNENLQQVNDDIFEL